MTKRLAAILLVIFWSSAFLATEARAQLPATFTDLDAWLQTQVTIKPMKPDMLSPANGATNVPTTTAITWRSIGAIYSDVYFGTSSNPPKVVTNGAPFTYAPAMLPGTQYCYKVGPKNLAGYQTSNVTCFTTATGTVVSPNCTKVVPGGASITLAGGAAWSLSASGATLQNGVQMGGGFGSAMEVSGGQIQVSGSPDTSTWYLWSGSAWQNTGLGDPCAPPPPPPTHVTWLEFTQEDPIFGVTSYNVYVDTVKTAVALTCLVPTNTCTGLLPSLTSGTHTVAVSAVSSLGESSTTTCTACSGSITIP